MSESHSELVRETFSRQAKGYASRSFAAANTDGIRWIVDNIVLESGDRVLDVAAGTGLVGRAIAPRVREVIGLDMTRAMIEQGRRQASDEGIRNVQFEEGLAEALPYPDGSFDLIVSRFSVHHFQEPSVQLAEMCRVCRPGGRIAIIDLTAPADPGLAATYNRWERLRDPSHTRALGPDELRALVSGVGFRTAPPAVRDFAVTVDSWFDLAGASQDVRHEVIGALKAELRGGDATGMRPVLVDGRMFYPQAWAIVSGKKDSKAND